MNAFQTEQGKFYVISTILGLIVWKLCAKDNFLQFVIKWALASIVCYYGYKGLQK
jgi:hypothetical protein